nr:hypothetical protein [Allomuricauda sp.]
MFRKTSIVQGFVLFLLPMVALIGQSVDSNPNPEESLLSYHNMPRESLFIHSNKTLYVAGEEIWFSGYVFDRKNQKPFAATTNVYVGIYDSIGKQVAKKLFLSRDGYLKGNIPLDSTFTAGTFYLKASTNWMRNFKEDDSFVQKIKILSTSQKTEPIDDAPLEYDIQFLPEGGDLIAETVNNIGVKVLNSRGYGVALQNIKVYDNQGALITQFNTTPLGFAKFDLTPKPRASYYAEVNEGNNKKKRFKLPIAKPKGINVRIQNNQNQDKVGVVFRTNKSTIDELESQTFYFLIHKDEKSKRIPVSFDKEALSAVFFINRADLEKGVNIITLFDENNAPVLERMIFNNTDLVFEDELIGKTTVSKDSLSIGFNSQFSNATISVSVLPQGTSSYNTTDNIISTFYLKPYLSGFVENPKYYFLDRSQKKDYELDLLMLTQGWSRYSWNNVQFNAPKEKYAFEDGMVLTGTVSALKENFNGQILLHDTRYHGQQLIPVSYDKNKFAVASFFPERDEILYLSLLDKNGKVSRPGAYVTLKNNSFTETLNNRWEDNYRDLFEQEDEPTNIDYLITDKTISLDEVLVTGNRKENITEDNTFALSFLKNKVTEIDRRAVQDFPFFTDILRAKFGYEIREDLQFGTFSRISITSRRGGSVNLVIDGIRQPDFDILYRLPTGQLESYYVDRLSRFEGARSQLNETLYIFTRRGAELGRNEEDETRIRALQIPVKTGFEKTKEFYLPKYSTFSNSAFVDYGIIHWEPQLILDGNGNGEFKALNTGLKEIILFVEGMSPNGKLVSAIKTINIAELP